MNIRWFALVLLTTSAPVSALAPEEFAYGLRLETPPGGAIYRLELPETVYRGAKRPDLGDLRVFNGRGEPVPHAVRTPALPKAESSPFQPVPLFPLVAEAEGARPQLQIRIDERGALVDARPSDLPVPERVEAYVIDLTGLKSPPGRLDFNFEGPDFAARARISAGNDLSHWRSVGEASLASLHFGDNYLVRREATLSSPPAEHYLRLEWPPAARKARLVSVSASAPIQAAPVRKWVAPELKAVAGEGVVYEFERPGVLPFDRIRIVPQEPNTVARVRFLQREPSAKEWRPAGGGMVYDLTADGERLTGEPIPLQAQASLWRVEAPAGAFGVPPRIELGYLPRELLFAARGEGPFLLAWGSAGTLSQPGGLDPVLAARPDPDPLLREARPGAELQLGGPGRLEPELRVPWQRIALWALLIAGVAGLGFMALRLIRDLPRER